MGFALFGSRDLASVLARWFEIAEAVPGYPAAMVNAHNAEVTVSIQWPAASAADQLVLDTILAAAHRLIGWAIGTRLELRRVELPYPKPIRRADDYRTFFGAPTEVVFSAPAAALVFDEEFLSSPLTRTEAELEEFLECLPNSFLRRDNAQVSCRVRRLLAEECLTGNRRSTTEELAARLSMSSQTLRRRLRDEQTSIRQVREAVLRDEAVASLVRGEETVAALSHRLGFSEPSAFARAFRRWTGSSPSTYVPRGHRRK